MARSAERSRCGSRRRATDRQALPLRREARLALRQQLRRRMPPAKVDGGPAGRRLSCRRGCPAGPRGGAWPPLRLYGSAARHRPHGADGSAGADTRRQPPQRAQPAAQQTSLRAAGRATLRSRQHGPSAGLPGSNARGAHESDRLPFRRPTAHHGLYDVEGRGDPDTRWQRPQRAPTALRLVLLRVRGKGILRTAQRGSNERLFFDADRLNPPQTVPPPADALGDNSQAGQNRAELLGVVVVDHDPPARAGTADLHPSGEVVRKASLQIGHDRVRAPRPARA